MMGMLDGGGSLTAGTDQGGHEGGSFIDCDPENGTGEEIQGAYWKCGACHGILREGDKVCPNWLCGEPIDDPESMVAI